MYGLMDVCMCFCAFMGISCRLVASVWPGDEGYCGWLTVCNGLPALYCSCTCTGTFLKLLTSSWL
jgi:hypothetical protein